MSIRLPSGIVNLKGQVVKGIELNRERGEVTIRCTRDKRYSAIEPETGKHGTINRYVRRIVTDIPLLGYRCFVAIELAQVRINSTIRRLEACAFVEKGCYYTKRFCQLVSGLCRHMTIQAVARHFGLRWETVKNMDKVYLERTLPALNSEALVDLTYIGVDEVARAKGHDYMTVVYDMVSGHLIWVHEGRTAATLSLFLNSLPEAVKAGILGVAMDMSPSYQSAVREHLPNADIIFDRFHVMQNYGKAIVNQRRVEFRKANQKGKELIKGSRYLLLKNADKLTEEQGTKLHALLKENKNINLIYMLKEQLQLLWHHKSYKAMESALETWCEMAEATDMIYIQKFAKSLRKNKVGICNYAKHPLTTARIEAGNVGIGLIRKRARGLRDTAYFKLKIRQLSVPDTQSMFYKSAA